MLCLDVVQIICDYADLRTQITLISACREYHENIKISKLYCSAGLGERISQDIKGIKGLQVLRELNAFGNRKITSVNHLGSTLTKLDCRWLSGISQKGIKGLRVLRELNAIANSKITSVNHLGSTLTKLDCSGLSGISQEGIKGLRVLRELNARDNSKITDVNHLGSTLIKLDCSWLSGISQEGIKVLRVLRELNAYDNSKITDISHLETLIRFNGEIVNEKLNKTKREHRILK
jgi:hypothetical protein